jgi:hypothetical protein
MKEIRCPICSNPFSVRLARGRKSNKPFIMLKCDKDGRHFRGFITEQNYVRRVLKDYLPSDKKDSLETIQS